MNKQQLLKSLKEQGFSKKILKAFSEVEREDFVPARLKRASYEDTALPIGKGQTISQPYTIAMMLSLLDLRKGKRVLEAGSGSGYVLALISKIVGEKGMVSGLEIISDLVVRSKESLKSYSNVKVYNRNASSGLPKKAPFDRILISAATEKIPRALLSQLKEGGILVAPLGTPGLEQSLVAIKKTEKGAKKIKEIPGFVFVPFVANGKV